MGFSVGEKLDPQMVVSKNFRGPPVIILILAGIFHEINPPASLGIPIYGKPHMGNRWKKIVKETMEQSWKTWNTRNKTCKNPSFLRRNMEENGWALISEWERWVMVAASGGCHITGGRVRLSAKAARPLGDLQPLGSKSIASSARTQLVSRGYG